MTPQAAMVWKSTSSYCFSLYLFLALFVHRGVSQISVESTVPASGNIISDFVSERNVSLFCEVTVDGAEHATSWSILTLEDKETRQDPGPIPRDDPQFVLSGDIITIPEFVIPSNRNLTIVGLTANLHDSTFFCGAQGSRVANFTFLIYDYPSLPNNVSVIAAATHAHITWDPPTNPGSPEVAYYQLIVYEEDGDVLHNVSLSASSPREFNATGLQPGDNHTLSIRAVSQLSPVPVIGNATEVKFTTNFTVPLVNCTAAQVSDQRAVGIYWDNIHSGGLGLTSAVVEYTLSPGSMGAEFTEVMNASIDLEGSRAEFQSLPTAGLTYVFRVTTENAEGESIPSECPALLLEIGIPSIPNTPTAVANGPLAQVMLRTSEAGVGDPPHSFRFFLQVYRFDSTDNGTEFVREVEEGLTYPEYKSGDTVVANVEGLELEMEYQFAARAANMFGTSQVSNLSNPVLLNLSVPVISEVVTLAVEEGIVIEWNLLHNGGLDILAVDISLRQDPNAPFQLVQGGSLTRPQSNTFLIAGRFLQAGQRYQAAVSATNALGRSELVAAESRESPVGIPATPATPTVTSVSPSSVVLTLQTASSGLFTPGNSFRFIVLVNSSDSGPEEFVSLSRPFPSYMSGESVQVTVDTLEQGRSYVFSAQVENMFGRSNSSGVSENVTVPFSDEESDGLSTGEVIGIAIAVFIVLVMVMVIVALVIFIVMNKGGRGGKLRKSRRESDTDLGIHIAVPHIDTDVSYPRKREDTPFPPEAYESQYEPDLDMGPFIMLRPKPTHPTGLLEQDDQPHPLYDMLSPHERASAISLSSGKELPNPLYSGLPASAGNSRPTSQFHDSGSGSVQHSSGTGVVQSGFRGGTGGEPQYSEATGQSSSDGQAPLYTEPTSRMSRSSQYLEDPPPPPLPPHPRDFPMYAEAGPPSGVEEYGRSESEPNRPLSLGSEEHLYSELKDYPRKKQDARTPVFHAPPPPPSQTESSGEFTSHSSEGEVTVPMGDKQETVL